MQKNISSLIDRLSVPVLAAPMFLASNLKTVIAACRSGVVGSYPALNQRTTGGLDEWLDQAEAGIAEGPLPGVERLGPLSINLVVHKSNARLKDDLDVVIRHKVPVVVTSLGAIPEVVQAIQSYGGVVLHDVISVKYAEKAILAGVDGIIAVCSGAGGHGGTLNPFAFLHELRELSDKAVILSGALSTGRQVAAAIVAGADMVSIGTRFIAVEEATVSEGYKQMIVDSAAGDIVYTNKVSGVNANFLKQSILSAGLDLNALETPGGVDFGGGDSDTGVATGEAKPWRDIWSAGQGVGAIKTIPRMAELIATMRDEFHQALEQAAERRSSKGSI